MKYIMDCHSHTIVSGHAYSTVDEYARQAKKVGLQLIAITDHAPAMPGSAHIFYFQNFKVIPRFLHGVEILKGSEVNILDNKGNLDLPEDILETLDIVIASVHLPCYKEENNDNVIEAYINAMKNPYVNIIGHADDSRYPVDYELFVKNAKENNILVEVNNSSISPKSFRMNARENYKTLLEKCKKYEVPIIISSDSHFYTQIGDFKYVDNMLKEFNFPQELIINTSINKLKKYL